MSDAPTVTSVSIRVKFFAGLRERLGRGEAEVRVPVGSDLRAVWRAASGDADIPPRLLVAVNQAYAGWEQGVTAGDEVAFFPPVTGG